MTDLTPNRAGELPGPSWLSELRRSAAETFADRGVPTSAEEVWRYSRIGELDLDAVDLVDGPASSAPHEPDDLDRGRLSGVIRIIDGHLVEVDVDSGLTVTDATTADAPGLVGPPGDGTESFNHLNLAFAPAPLVVAVDPGATIEHPLLVEVRVETPGGLTFPRLVVSAGAGARLSVIERHSSGDVTGVSVPVTELHAEDGAELHHVLIQDLGFGVWQLGALVANSGTGATIAATCVGLGGDYARQRIDMRLVADDSSAEIAAVYFAEGDQMLDYRTVQDHIHGNSRSDLLFKGAVADRSHSVYTGNIRIAKDAGNVDAFQTNRTIKLSDEAWAESVPNLEIENNDVRCSHASAIGPIDTDQRFYLESRGVPPEVSERLVVLGFFDEVLDRIPVPSLAAELRNRMAARFLRAERSS